MKTLAEQMQELIERPMFFDRAGNPITTGRWMDLHADVDYCTVAETIIGGVWRVHTAWLGHDLGFFGPPVIFETMTFELAESHGYIGPSAWSGDGFGFSFHESIGRFEDRYSTETQARAGHRRIVAKARELFLPIRL